jgi:hypothetical protein
MQIIAQSQAPTRVSYIHLAYISAQLDNRISKGDLLSMQTVLGIAFATAIACAAVGGRLAGKGTRARGIKIGAFLGFFAGLCVMWMIEAEWRERRSNEEVVKHVLETRQFWALRDARIATGVEAAANTNGAAAALAATYYSMKGYSVRATAPEMVVKGYWYCEQAAAKGHGTGWVSTNDLARGENVEAFQLALALGRLSPAEQVWARQKLAEITREPQAKEPVDPK